jgi:Zn ribbon nucleic-acid-binding protein
VERVIDCPICYDSDTCFEDSQEKFKSYMCFNCGFMSNTTYTKENSDKVENTSQLVNELKYYDDDRKIYWYPSVVNMGPKGIIFPEGSVEEWVWKYAEVVEVPKEEQEQYPIPDKDGEFYTEKLDVENAETYGQYEFLEACKKMGITMEVPNA